MRCIYTHAYIHNVYIVQRCPQEGSSSLMFPHMRFFPTLGSAVGSDPKLPELGLSTHAQQPRPWGGPLCWQLDSLKLHEMGTALTSDLIMTEIVCQTLCQVLSYSSRSQDKGFGVLPHAEKAVSSSYNPSLQVIQ